jgi:hypothetical protein
VELGGIVIAEFVAPASSSDMSARPVVGRDRASMPSAWATRRKAEQSNCRQARVLHLHHRRYQNSRPSQ